MINQESGISLLVFSRLGPGIWNFPIGISPVAIYTPTCQPIRQFRKMVKYYFLLWISLVSTNSGEHLMLLNELFGLVRPSLKFYNS